MKNILRNWRTTLAGAVTVASVIGSALEVPGDPGGNLLNVVLDPKQLAVLAAGIAAILGKDAGVTGTTP